MIENNIIIYDNFYKYLPNEINIKKNIPFISQY